MLQRIAHAVGLEPVGTSDCQSGSVEWETCISFSRELTEAEKLALDSVMTDNPSFPPDSPTRFVIQDVWNKRESIGQAIGIPYRIFYSQSVPGGEVDHVEMHFDRDLTEQEKLKVIEEYGKLIQEV